MSKLNQDQFRAKFTEYKNAVAVCRTGMPQANAHEQRAMHSRVNSLEKELATSDWYEHRSGEIRKKGFGYRISELFKA